MSSESKLLGSSESKLLGSSESILRMSAIVLAIRDSMMKLVARGEDDAKRAKFAIDEARRFCVQLEAIMSGDKTESEVRAELVSRQSSLLLEYDSTPENLTLKRFELYLRMESLLQFIDFLGAGNEQ